MGHVGALVKGPFQPADEGYVLRIEPIERAALHSVLALLDGTGDLPERLVYTPYPEDPAAGERYRELVADDLDQMRREDRDLYRSVVAGDPASPEAIEAFMRVVGEARLVLAARVGIEHDGWEQSADPTDPQVALLGWLGHLQDWAVEISTEWLS